MKPFEETRKRLSLPPVSQIGIVVREMEGAVDHYSSAFGLGPFTVYEFAPDKHWYREEPSPVRLRMGKAMLGGIEVELLQPLDGKSDHREFLETRGEGLHHLGFNVADYDEVFGKFLEEGFEPLMRAETFVPTYNGYLRACYFDTRRIGGVLFEILWKSWLTSPVD